MTSTADLPISALRSGHEKLAALVKALPDGGVTGPSGAAEWTIAQVLSHLGSGAEIGLAGLNASLDGAQKPADGFNRNVWDRWDAMEPQQQADAFLVANEKFVSTYEGLDEQTRNEGLVDLGFLPEPLDVATAASFRLNEFTLHSWDVAVASDPDATLAPEAAGPLLDVVPYLLGWIGKPADVLGGKSVSVAVHTTDPATDFGLEITDKVAITAAPAAPDAVLTLPAESWERLATGRLGTAHTPSTVTVIGAITIEQLRAIFPGF